MSNTNDSDLVKPTADRPYPYYDAHVHARKEELERLAKEKASVAEHMEASIGHTSPAPWNSK